MSRILLRRYKYAYEATTDISILEGVEIPYYLDDSTLSQLNDYLSYSNSGVCLFVDAAHYEKAHALLNENNPLEDNPRYNPYTFKQLIIGVLIFLLIVLYLVINYT